MNNINQAVEALEKGNIIIYPTETSYALGADATNSEAVEKIFQTKERDRGKPLSIIVSSLEMIQKYAEIDGNTKKLIEKFMPGPLTLIVPLKTGLADNLCKDTVAFRISSNQVAQELCEKFQKPITATSANLSGNEPIYNIDEIKNQFDILIVDAGNLPKNEVSTIYDTISKKVLRPGPIPEQDIV
tara:strand:+ start:2816 stop:3373 length:558 start_codon:yes stop_codon:yes gene_type:complete